MVIQQKAKLVCCLAALAFAAASPRIASAQGPCGGKPCPRIIVDEHHRYLFTGWRHHRQRMELRPFQTDAEPGDRRDREPGPYMT